MDFFLSSRSEYASLLLCLETLRDYHLIFVLPSTRHEYIYHRTASAFFLFIKNQIIPWQWLSSLFLVS